MNRRQRRRKHARARIHHAAMRDRLKAALASNTPMSLQGYEDHGGRWHRRRSR